MNLHSLNLVKSFIQKMFLCFSISALIFWYFYNSYNIMDIPYNSISSLFFIEFLLLYFINIIFSFDKLIRYSLLFQILIIVLSLIFGFMFYLYFSITGEAVILSFLTSIIIVFLAMFLAIKYGKIDFTDEVFGFMRHLFIFSLIFHNFKTPVIISKVVSLLYAFCLFIVFNYYFYYADSMITYNKSEQYIDAMSNFLLITILPGMHFLCINLCYLFY